MFYSEKSVTSLTSELSELQREKDRLLLDLIHLAENLQVSQASLFLREGVLRRLGSIHRCAENVFSIYPPNRRELLHQSELSDLGIYLQSFLINTYGILDNLAWVCALSGGFPDPENHWNRVQISLFKSQIKPYLPEKLLRYLKEGPPNNWFENYAKRYRDSTVHRIPPYIPPSCVASVDVEILKKLQRDALATLSLHDYENYLRIKKDEDELGSPIPYVALTLSSNFDVDPPIIMHPQIVSDLLTIHDLLKQFAAGMREMYAIEECSLLKRGII